MSDETSSTGAPILLSQPIGIDLGTTNSAAAMMRPEGDDILLLQDNFARKTMPSVVGWDPDSSEIIVGHRAWNRRLMQPYPVTSIKRRMGTPASIELGPDEHSPDDISALILGELRAQMHTFANAAQNAPDDLQAHPAPQFIIDRAVITVPAYFDAPQIEATRRAGSLANLDVLGLLQEPTAAAMYYAFKHNIHDANFLVYDLGGGTFDVSVLRAMMGEYQVLAVDGDNYLGGDDFDRRLAEVFRQHLVEKGYQLDLDVAHNPEDQVRFTLLTRVAREVKEALTNSQFEYVGRRDLFADQAGQSVTLDLEVSRDEFERLIADMVDQTIVASLRALAQSAERADVGLADIDHVLLVGGSTHIPLVQRKIRDAFCGPGNSRATRPLIDEPDTCVALGAAIHAANLGGVQWVDPAEPRRRLTVTSRLTARHDTHALRGYLTAPLPAGITSVALCKPSGEIVTVCGPELRPATDATPERLLFDFDAVPLELPGRHDFLLEFCADSGESRASFAVSLKRAGSDAPLRPTGSALSNPSVLAKDIYLEIAADNAPERFLLIERGASLPAKRSFRFFTADRSGALLLRVFQQRYPIRTIHLSIPPETELGTPVDLTIEVDDTMTIVASGKVGMQEFSARIEAPAPAELRDWAQIDALLETVDQVRHTLWGLEKNAFAHRVDPLIAGIRETARTDPDKLQVLVRRLEEVMQEYQARPNDLTPGFARYSALINAIRRVVFRDTDKAPLGRPSDAWREHLAEIDARATRAWQQRDAHTWRQTFDQVQATWESLAQDEFRFAPLHAEDYTAQLHQGLQMQVIALLSALDEFVLSTQAQTRDLQRREVMRLKADIEDELQDPLARLRPEDADPQTRTELARLAEVGARLEKRMQELATLGLVRR